jgi:hypothetical protein
VFEAEPGDDHGEAQGEAPRAQWQQQSTQDQPGRDEMQDATLGSFEKVDNINEENWVKIAGIPGLVVSGFWIPVLGPTVVLQKNTEERVARGASRRGLNPQLALLALANMRLRDQLHQKP